MTGFGSASAEGDRGTLSVEIRSVNARHLRLRFALPTGLEEWEPELRDRVSERVERGRVDIALRVEEKTDSATSMELDRERVESYLEAFETLRDEYALPGQVDLPILVTCGGLLRERASTAEWASLDDAREVTGRALGELVAMREREGRRLEGDLRERLEAIGDALGRVEELAPRRLERERERLAAAVTELLGDRDSPEDGGRAGKGEPGGNGIAREIALLADRWDIGEEVVRARAHLSAFDELLATPAAEAVGKRLKFLAQELHREINTTGAKANDAAISRQVVEMKNELESMREQIENVE